MLTIPSDEPLAIAVVEAIRSGSVDTLKRLLAENTGLASARIEEVTQACRGSRTLLHIVTDWPGNFPNGPEVVAILLAHGADVNAKFIGRHSETPLHWAASCDDVAVLDTLLDHGANIEAPGAVIGGGTPVADAVAFGQWRAASRLVERGSRTNLWQSAALGLMARIEEHFTGDAPPTPEEVTNAFWCACHGGQLEPAKYLLARGVDINWVGYDKLTPLDAASRSGAGQLVAWLQSQSAQSAKQPA